MKFGAQLQDAILPEWQAYYLDYDLLKKKLRKAENEQAFTERDETEFVEMLDSNLEKVYAFHKAKMNGIRQEIDSCATAISSATTNNSSNTELQEKINAIADDINRLEKFTRVNYTGFLKIVKKHDRHTNYILRPMFMVRLNQCPFWRREDQDNFDALLMKLSELFSQVRDGNQTMSFKQPSEESYQVIGDQRRMIVKRFFVHTDDIFELRTSVLRHLPVLVYHDLDRNTTAGEEEQDIDPPISSLYLDNAEMDVYCSRVESAHHSQIIRLRWYGSANRNRHISVERRTLEDEHRGELKDKFTIKDKYVDGYLKGDKTFLEKSVQKMKEGGKSAQEIEMYTELVQGVQKQIMDKHLQPVLRTYYKRTAFQIPGDKSVRMALDTDLCFLREDSNLFPDEPIIRRPPPNWHRPDADINFPFTNIKQDVEVNRYPYATFEIKLDLATHEKEPKWVVDLQESGLLEEAYQFSKFVHGMAIMFDTRVPLLPYWLAQIDDDRKLLPMLPSQSPSVSTRKQHTSKKKEEAVVMHKQQPEQSTSAAAAAEVNESTSLLQNQQGQEGSTISVASYLGVDISLTRHQPQVQASTSSNSIFQRLLTDFPDQIGHMAHHLFNPSTSRDEQVQPTGLPPGVKIPKKVITPIRVEPKVFFANERTYFSWMQFGTLMATFSLALFNSGDAVGKICGLLYTLVALSTLIYGAGLYYRRRELIRARLPGPYDEMVGPTVICFALLFAVGINAYLKFTVTTPTLYYLSPATF